MDTSVVRVWMPGQHVVETVLRGVARNVATGAEKAFRCETEVLGIIGRATDRGWPEIVQEATGGDAERI